VLERPGSRRRLSLVFGFFFRFVGVGAVTPGIGLRAGNNAGNIRIFAGIARPTRSTTLPRFGTSCRFFLLFFRTGALALAFSPR
jgi:hypothetical protein